VPSFVAAARATRDRRGARPGIAAGLGARRITTVVAGFAVLLFGVALLVVPVPGATIVVMPFGASAAVLDARVRHANNAGRVPGRYLPERRATTRMLSKGMTSGARAAVVASAFAAVSCGAVIGQVPFDEEGTGETGIDARAGTLRFWTVFSARFPGFMDARYDVDLVQDGVVVAATSCNALYNSPKVCYGTMKTSERLDLNCRMSCSAVVPRAGPTTVRARFSIQGRPSNLQLVRAILVVRQ
jgi:hypothetical protein